KHRVAHVQERMVQYALRETRCRNQAFLGIVNGELLIAPDRHAIVEDLVAEPAQLGVEVRDEAPGIRLAALAAQRPDGGEPQVVPTGDRLNEVARSLHGWHLPFVRSPGT